MNQKCRNIVILCGKFYPNIGAPEGCFLPYIKELSKHNHVTVVCQKTSNMDGKMPVDNIKLYQVTSFYNNIKCTTSDWELKGKTNSFYRNVAYFVLKAGGIRSLYKFPDQNKWLINEYLKVLTEIRNTQNIDVIISISYPFTAHLASLYYKTVIDRNVKWITYTTDPYAHNEPVQYNHPINRKFKRKWALKKEKEIFDNADYNIVTEELYYHLLEVFAQPKEKTISFPYLLNSSLNRIKTDSHETPLKAVFAGSLYVGIRNPEVMLRVFSQLKGVSLDLYTLPDFGSKQLLNKYKSDNIHLNGFVNRIRYEEILRKEADVLVNIGNNVSLQSPSKFLELVSTGKPIINFYSVKDSAYRLIENYPLGINIPNRDFSNSYIEKISDFLRQAMGKSFEFNELQELFPNNVFKNHVTILNRVLSE